MKNKIFAFHARKGTKIELNDIEEKEIEEETYKNFRWDGVNILHFEHCTTFCHIDKDTLNIFKVGLLEGINFCLKSYNDYLKEIKCQEND